MLKAIRQVLNSPWTNMTIALILIYTSGSEVVREIADSTSAPGAHHGMLSFGIFQLFKILPDFFKGLEHSVSAAEKINQKESVPEEDNHLEAS